MVLMTLVMVTPSCKKDKFITDPGSKLEFSQDSVLFDTVFTSIGSSTRNFRIRNRHSQKIRISSIVLQGGTGSPFKLNVDGVSGALFSNLELAAGDSMYVFVQVKVDPNNSNSPLIVSDNIVFHVNGNEQKVPLEAWGQDAYYHRPSSALKFKDGSYMPYSLVSELPESYNLVGNEYVWKNDKPHVIYGYLVVDGEDKEKNRPAQKLKIPAGTKVYLNYKAGIWVYSGGQIQVLGQKGKEVIFQGARREKDWIDEPGQWDRIWINEGSDDNIIDYAIIKNGYIGVQCELFGDDSLLAQKRLLRLSNTRIQNMSMWGVYGLAYRILGTNNVVTNCQEHSLNIMLGGAYTFVHCTFANYWNKGKVREKTTININNHSSTQVIPLNLYVGNCVVDGRLDDELTLDLKDDAVYTYTYVFSNNWIKSGVNTSNTTRFINNRLGNKDSELKYKDFGAYDFSPADSEKSFTGFVHAQATEDAKAVPTDILGKTRNTGSVTAGAYEIP